MSLLEAALGVWALINVATVGVGELNYRKKVREARERWENEIDRRHNR